MIKDLIDILKIGFDFVRTGYIENKEQKRFFFYDTIDKSFEKMELIHTDYLKNLNLLIRIHERKEKSTPEIIEWLKEQKITYQTTRLRIKKVGDEVYDSGYFNRTFGKNQEISNLANQYVHDIINYFYNSTKLQDMTWYSYLIWIYESSFDFQNKSKDDASVGTPVGQIDIEIFEEIRKTIKIIENHFGYLTESYTMLKILCLK